MAEIYIITPQPTGTCLGEFLRAANLPVECNGTAARAIVERVCVHSQRREWKIYLSFIDSAVPGNLDKLAEALTAALPEVDSVYFHKDENGGHQLPALSEEQELPLEKKEQELPAEKKEQKLSIEAKESLSDGEDLSLDDLLWADEEAYMALVMNRLSKLGSSPKTDTSPTGGKNRSTQVIRGRLIEGEPRPISEITDEERSCILEGEIMRLEERKLRSGRRLVLIDITDYTNSVGIKVFEEEKDPRLAERLQSGMWIRVRGAIQFDRFTQELTVFPTDIQAQPVPDRLLRKDEAGEKRVELHLHTKMSAMDGTVDVNEAIKIAAEWGHPAIAITDHGVVQAFPEAYAAGKEHGIKIIYGLEGYLIEGDDPKTRSYHIILLARNQTGLRNLYKLVSLSHLDYFYRRPRLPRAAIAQYREGLIIGSACEAGEVYQACLRGASDEELARIAAFYDYLEIQPLANNEFLIGSRVESVTELQEINRRLVVLGRKLNKPVVATGDVHYLHPWDEVYRRILMAAQGYADAERQAPLYLRTTEEMLAEFAYLGEDTAYEVVVAAPTRLAAMIEDLRPVPEGLHAPVMEGAEDQIVAMTYAKAREIYGDPLPDIVARRLDKELKSIVGNGFSVLYLIAHKLVKKSLDDGYLVGSRGSVGSSLVATMCGITEVNPLPPHYVCPRCHHSEFFTDGSVGAGVDLPDKRCPCGALYRKEGFDIPFEVFLGFHGDKVPDIDLNFSGEYQSVVHKYTEELFGPDYVFRAGTIGTLAEKTAYGFVRKYLESKGEQARSAEINRLVRGCTGVRRTTGQHPGGMMVVPRGHDIHEFTPIQYPANDSKSGVITTHFDYHAISERLVKLDILGHDDPTVIRMLEDLTGISARDIPLDDPATMEIFSGLGSLGVEAADIGTEVGTLGIPEFGTRFVRQMLEETRPKTFSELVRISGFSHGTNVWTNNAQDLIKAGIADLSQAIATRDDIMNYLIQCGMEPAVAFKIMEKVRKGKGLQPEDEKAMQAAGVPRWYIESCRKITYLFPKAHAVAYVTMAFRIAYFKVHEPLAFYATYFTVRASDFDAQLVNQGQKSIRATIATINAKGNGATAKEMNIVTISEVVLEAMARGIGFLPVDLYESHPTRFQIKGNHLLPPLVALPGVGINAALALARARQEGKFASVEELSRRAGVTKTVVEALSEHGSLKGLPEMSQLSLF